MPGMVDTHIHAPQYSFIGTGMERPLLEWLKHTTFPIEDAYANLETASNVYNSVVVRFHILYMYSRSSIGGRVVCSFSH